MDNIYPDNITTKLIQSFNRSIIPVLRKRANEICKLLIGEKYIHSAFNRFKKGYTYTVNDTIIGFSLWKEKNILYKNDNYIKSLHIILICGNHKDFKLGKKILFDIESYCLDNNIGTISLEAANDDLVKYYIDNGYVLSNIPKTLIMHKEV